MPSESFRVETIKQLQRELAALPPCTCEELTTTQKNDPPLLEMGSRGYSVAALTTLLDERGVGISAVALRRYLRNGIAGRNGRPARAKKRRARMAVGASRTPAD
jgi:hypothetical protein